MFEIIVKLISEENLAKICEHTPSKKGRKLRKNLELIQLKEHLKEKTI